MIETISLDLKLPGTIRKIWDKLIVHGIYISSENERDLYNDISRYEDDVCRFLEIFDHQLIRHRKGFIFAEDKKNKRLLKNHEQLMVFLAVFFEKYQKLNTSPVSPWYEEIVRTTQTLGKVNIYSTETSERRLLSAGLNDEFDIYEKVLKPASAQFLLHINSADQHQITSSEAAKRLEFKFNTPIHRFIDVFSELADYNTMAPEVSGEVNSDE